MNNNFSNPITSHPFLNFITVPLKFWRKKPVNTYTTVIYDGVDEDLYVFKSFGKSMKRSSHYTPRPRSDLILWGKSVHELELLRDLHIENDVDTTIHHKIINIIHDNYDSFWEKGVSWPMLDFEFVSTQIIHRQFVADNLFKASTRVRKWTNS